MKKLLTAITLATLLFAGVWAQNRGAGNAGARQGTQSAVPKTLSTLNGTVASVDLGIAQGSPSIVVDDAQILLAPYFYLEAIGFSVEVGDEVEVIVFPSLVYDDLLVAVSINNISQVARRNRAADLEFEQERSANDLRSLRRRTRRGCRDDLFRCGGLLRGGSG